MNFTELEKQAIFNAANSLINDYTDKGHVNRVNLAKGVIAYLNSPGDRGTLCTAISPYIDYVAFAYERDIREAEEFNRDLVKSYQAMA